MPALAKNTCLTFVLFDHGGRLRPTWWTKSLMSPGLLQSQEIQTACEYNVAVFLENAIREVTDQADKGIKGAAHDKAIQQTLRQAIPGQGARSAVSSLTACASSGLRLSMRLRYSQSSLLASQAQHFNTYAAIASRPHQSHPAKSAVVATHYLR